MKILYPIKSLCFLLFFFSYQQLFSQIQKINLPQGNYTFTFQEDNNNNVWLGLSDGNIQGGLGLFREGDFVLVSGSDSIPSGSYHTSTKLPDGSILFAGTIQNKQGFSLLVWVSDSGVDTIQIPFRLKDPLINCISLVNNREIWIGTASGLLINSRGDWQWLTTAQGLPSNFISTIFQDFRGVIWIGTESGIAYYYDQKLYYPEPASRIISTATHFFGDIRGYVWCGARFGSEGVSVYNGQVWDTFSGRNGLIDNSVSIFYQDNNQNLWVGSCFSRNRGGVSVFDGKKWTGFDAPDFLAKPCVDAIVSDTKGRVWFGGSLTHKRNRGITIYDGESWIKIPQSNIFPAERVISFFLDSKGNIWISSFEGLFLVEKDFDLAELISN